MRNPFIALATATMVSLFALSAPVSAQTFSFQSLMLPSNEVPAIPPDQSTKSGTGFVSFNTATETASWSLTGYDPTGGFRFWHIHTGGAGAIGTVVVNFNTALTGTNVPYASIGASVTPTLVSSIIANPELFYFNAHSNTFPGGEIRAQLVAVVPEAGTLPLVASALAMLGSVAFLARRRKAA